MRRRSLPETVALVCDDMVDGFILSQCHPKADMSSPAVFHNEDEDCWQSSDDGMTLGKWAECSLASEPSASDQAWHFILVSRQLNNSD